MEKTDFIKLTNFEDNTVFVLNINNISRVTETICRKKKNDKIIEVNCRKIYLNDGTEIFVLDELNDIYNKII